LATAVRASLPRSSRQRRGKLVAALAMKGDLRSQPCEAKHLIPYGRRLANATNPFARLIAQNGSPLNKSVQRSFRPGGHFSIGSKCSARTAVSSEPLSVQLTCLSSINPNPGKSPELEFDLAQCAVELLTPMYRFGLE